MARKRTDLEKALQARLDEEGCAIDAKELIRLITEHIAKHPPEIEALFPGHVLNRRPMTPTERAKIAVPAAVAARRRNLLERRSELQTLTRRIITREPAITDEQIRDLFNSQNVKPQRGTRWSLRSVRALRKSISDESTES